MAYLQRLPVDELKVDHSFVLNMTGEDNDAALVRGAIDLGHNLGLIVVAEGVESAEHVAALQRLGCDIAQGYHYARPMPPAELIRWMQRYESVSPRPPLVANTHYGVPPSADPVAATDAAARPVLATLAGITMTAADHDQTSGHGHSRTGARGR
jgi:EAL domain